MTKEAPKIEKAVEAEPDARSSESLVPMLIAGLVLTTLGYIVVMAFY